MTKLAFPAGGLLPAVAQDRLTGQVRLLAYVSPASVEATIASGRATFFSRSRGALWPKGETSGNVLRVAAVRADCDADAVLLLVDPAGPTGHTGAPSCFVSAVGPDGSVTAEAHDAAPVLMELERTIHERKAATSASSYTRALLDGGPERIGAKLREEAGELAEAIASEPAERVASEAADLLYHLLVGLASREVPLRDALAVLAARAGTSGHAEKAARPPKGT